MLDRVEFIFVTEVICQEQSKLLKWRDRVPSGRARHGEIDRISEYVVTVPEVAIMLIRRTDEKQNTRFSHVFDDRFPDGQDKRKTSCE